MRSQADANRGHCLKYILSLEGKQRRHINKALPQYSDKRARTACAYDAPREPNYAGVMHEKY